MEKLQSAIENARKKRATMPAEPMTAPADEQAVSNAEHAGHIEDAGLASGRTWSELKEFRPNPNHLIRKRVFTQRAIKEASYFDILRTKTLLMMRQKGWKRLAVTSPTPLCGKSTTIANIATSLGRQADIKSVLFDLDLRRPALHQIFGHTPENNIMELLREEVRFSDQAVRLGDNVALSLTARRARDSTQYMLSDQTAKVLDEIEVNHAPDIMLFDLPPLLAIDDTHAFLKNVDCILLLAKAEETTAKQIKDCYDEIAKQTNVLGVVMAQCRHNPEESSYEHY